MTITVCLPGNAAASAAAAACLAVLRVEGDGNERLEKSRRWPTLLHQEGAASFAASAAGGVCADGMIQPCQLESCCTAERDSVPVVRGFSAASRCWGRPAAAGCKDA
ncbi:MAG: hypothetical protein WDW38_005170 [Sanguina aurantia]